MLIGIRLGGYTDFWIAGVRLEYIYKFHTMGPLVPKIYSSAFGFTTDLDTFIFIVFRYTCTVLHIYWYMNYASVYERLIARAKSECRVRSVGSYYEAHHIIPKCMGGTDDHSNIVLLTAKEHFVAHRVLIRVYPGDSKIAYAYIMMCRMNNGLQSRVIPSSRAYQEARELHSSLHIPTGGRRKHAIYDTYSGNYYLGARFVRQFISASEFNAFFEMGRFVYVEPHEDLVYSTDAVTVPRKKLLDTASGLVYGVREWRAIKGNYHIKMMKMLHSGELKYVLA